MRGKLNMKTLTIFAFVISVTVSCTTGKPLLQADETKSKMIKVSSIKPSDTRLPVPSLTAGQTSDLEVTTTTTKYLSPGKKLLLSLTTIETPADDMETDDTDTRLSDKHIRKGESGHEANGMKISDDDDNERDDDERDDDERESNDSDNEIKDDDERSEKGNNESIDGDVDSHQIVDQADEENDDDDINVKRITTKGPTEDSAITQRLKISSQDQTRLRLGGMSKSGLQDALSMLSMMRNKIRRRTSSTSSTSSASTPTTATPKSTPALRSRGHLSISMNEICCSFG